MDAVVDMVIIKEHDFVEVSAEFVATLSNQTLLK